MINFIIYDDDKKWQQFYKSSILKQIGAYNIKYKFLIFNQYDKTIKEQVNNLIGKKIYLIDINVPGKSGIDFAREIRKNGDWQSPIIAITSYHYFKNNNFTSKTLMLDFIAKDKNVLKKLQETIQIALQIIKEKESFNFTYHNEYYQIPYEDIFYFEKNLNNNNTKIITKSNTYTIKRSITKLESFLETKKEFFKSHQSCIINIKNVKQVDFTNNLIYFQNTKINLLARNKKSTLKKNYRKNFMNIYKSLFSFIVLLYKFYFL